MIKFENNNVIIELSKEEIKRLLKEGILFNPSKDVYKFLDKNEYIFIRELKGGLENAD